MKKKFAVAAAILVAALLIAAGVLLVRRNAAVKAPGRTGRVSEAVYPYHWETSLWGKTTLTVDTSAGEAEWHWVAVSDHEEQIAITLAGAANVYQVQGLAPGNCLLTITAYREDESVAASIRIYAGMQDNKLVLIPNGEQLDVARGAVLEGEAIQLIWAADGSYAVLKTKGNPNGAWWNCAVENAAIVEAELPFVNSEGELLISLAAKAAGTTALVLESEEAETRITVQLTVDDQLALQMVGAESAHLELPAVEPREESASSASSH